MMMPANYSAINAEEMTYVNGGAVDISAAASTLGKNIVTIVANSFVSNLIAGTLGVLFGGSYVPGAVVGKIGAGLSTAYGKGGVNGVLNAGLQIIGFGAAVQQLATVDVKPVSKDKVIEVEGF